MSTAKAASVLQSRLLGDIDQWTSTVMTWSHLQRELENRSCPVNLLKGGTREEIVHCGNVVQMSDEQSGAVTTEKKRKRDDDSDEALTEKSEENARKG